MQPHGRADSIVAFFGLLSNVTKSGAESSTRRLDTLFFDLPPALAFHTAGSKRHDLEALLGDLGVAVLANTVTAEVEALEHLIDAPELAPLHLQPFELDVLAEHRHRAVADLDLFVLSPERVFLQPFAELAPQRQEQLRPLRIQDPSKTITASVHGGTKR